MKSGQTSFICSMHYRWYTFRFSIIIITFFIEFTVVNDIMSQDFHALLFIIVIYQIARIRLILENKSEVCDILSPSTVKV